MDINKNKLNKIPKVFDNFIKKSNTYIPAMHKNTVDTFESKTKQVSFKGDTVKKEDVLFKLKTIDIPEEVREKISSNLETQGQITLVNKFLSEPRLYGNENFQKGISSWLSKYDNEETIKSKMSILDQCLSDENIE